MFTLPGSEDDILFFPLQLARLFARRHLIMKKSLPKTDGMKVSGSSGNSRWKQFVFLPALLTLSFLLLHAMTFQHTSPLRPGDFCPEKFPQYICACDADQDGIADSADILQGALRYTASCPKYRSAYYEGGYPDDGCGVCTDVVASALREAGYDLRELVDEDIHAHPQDYADEVPDRNIDFRRVRNLKVYFSRNALLLPADLSDLSVWQGGDIVIFQDHIGIVSDRRNPDGVPYVIHHSGPWQKFYEEDILESRNDIVLHCRIC